MRYFWVFIAAFVFFAAPLATLTANTKTSRVSHKKYSVVLYINPSCPYCTTVLRTLDSLHKKIPIKDISSHPEYAKELVQIGGRRQVPCIVINGKALYESREIIKWLQENVEAY